MRAFLVRRLYAHMERVFAFCYVLDSDELERCIDADRERMDKMAGTARMIQHYANKDRR